MTKDLYDYFDDHMEYVSDHMMDSEYIIEPGTIYHYISSNFLDAFINYITIEKAYVLNRYDAYDYIGQESKLCVSIRDSKWNWEKKLFASKKELYELLNDGEHEMYHTNLSCFGDDVVVIGSTQKYIWFFWFDADVSDCSIGRIKKDGINIEDFIESVKQFIKPISENGESFEFKKEWIKGWIKY